MWYPPPTPLPLENGMGIEKYPISMLIPPFYFLNRKSASSWGGCLPSGEN